MPTQLEIEMEMKRRRDSDYKLLTEKEMLDAIDRIKEIEGWKVE